MQDLHLSRNALGTQGVGNKQLKQLRPGKSTWKPHNKWRSMEDDFPTFNWMSYI